jgi:hypothetical protein
MVTPRPSLRNSFSPVRLEDMYVVRIHHKDIAPYDVVTRLPFEKAVEACEAAEPSRGLTPPDALGHRDQHAYMHHRLRVDAWMENKARQSGVRIDDPHPVFFALTKDPTPFIETFIDGKPHPFLARSAAQRPDVSLVVAKVSDLDLTNWSFTVGDSFVGYAADTHTTIGDIHSDAHPLHGQVLNGAQLQEYLALHGMPDSTNATIDAQLWATAPAVKTTSPTAPSAHLNSDKRKPRLR